MLATAVPVYDIIEDRERATFVCRPNETIGQESMRKDAQQQDDDKEKY
jgi:hypothetical protein